MRSQSRRTARLPCHAYPFSWRRNGRKAHDTADQKGDGHSQCIGRRIDDAAEEHAVPAGRGMRSSGRRSVVAMRDMCYGDEQESRAQHCNDKSSQRRGFAERFQDGHDGSLGIQHGGAGTASDFNTDLTGRQKATCRQSSSDRAARSYDRVHGGAETKEQARKPRERGWVSTCEQAMICKAKHETSGS